MKVNATGSFVKYVTADCEHLDNKVLLLPVCHRVSLSTKDLVTCTCIARDAEHRADRDQDGVRKHDANINQNVECWGKKKQIN